MPITPVASPSVGIAEVSVNIKAELLASNVTASDAWHGSVVDIEPDTIEYPARGAPGLASVAGLMVKAEATAAWARSDDPCQLLAIAVSSALNIAVGLPWRDMGYTSWVDARRCEGRTLRDWEPYELVRFASRPVPGTHRVELSVAGLERIELLIAGALATTSRELWAAATPLAALDRATSDDHPYDRVRDLWTGFEASLPHVGSPMLAADRWLESATQRDRRFPSTVLGDVGKRITLLLRQRHRLARLPDTRPALRALLVQRLGSQHRRLLTAIAVAYVVRNQLYHGRWSHLTETELPLARAASRLLWRLVRADVEFRLTGQYLPTIRATTEISAPI